MFESLRRARHRDQRRRDQSRAYVGRQLQGGDQQGVGSLSAATRPPAHGQTLLQGGNMLLLDEPSTTSTSSPARSKRCWVPRQHLRHLARPLVLDRIATHILAFERFARFLPGNYREYRKTSADAWATMPVEAAAVQGVEVITAARAARGVVASSRDTTAMTFIEKLRNRWQDATPASASLIGEVPRSRRRGRPVPLLPRDRGRHGAVRLRLQAADRLFLRARRRRGGAGAADRPYPRRAPRRTGDPRRQARRHRQHRRTVCG